MSTDSASLAAGKVPAMRWLAIILGLVSLSLAVAAMVSLSGHDLNGICLGIVEPVRLLPGVISNSFRGYQPYLARTTQFAPGPYWFMMLPFLFFGGISAFFAMVAESLSTFSAARARGQAKAEATPLGGHIVPGQHSRAHFRYWPVVCLTVAAAVTAVNCLLLVRHLSPFWDMPPLGVQIAFVVQILVSVIVVGRAAA